MLKRVFLEIMFMKYDMDEKAMKFCGQAIVNGAFANETVVGSYQTT
jgi:hypothetical protein